LPSQITDNYLRAIEDHWLAIEQCGNCQNLQWYPRGFCLACGSDVVTFVPAQGSGSLYAYSIVHRPPNSLFNAFAPYVYALVDLAEGLRVTSWITDCDHDALEIGMPLQLHFIPGPEGRTLAVFRPSTDSVATGQGA
jgi:hypothetical protein